MKTKENNSTKNNKRKIVLDFDDTIAKSSEEIIRQINYKYGTNKTFKDLIDWGYTSIYEKITSQQVYEMYESVDFFQNVKFNEGAYEFIQKYKSIYHIIVCSKGTYNNLRHKHLFLYKHFGNDIEFQGMLQEDITTNKQDVSTRHLLDKSSIDFSDTLFCVDDNTHALLTLNSPCKILIKNYKNTYWNETPINHDNFYVINNFEELDTICEFNEQLFNKGLIISEI